jgi:hypothetical protein
MEPTNIKKKVPRITFILWSNYRIMYMPLSRLIHVTRICQHNKQYSRYAYQCVWHVYVSTKTYTRSGNFITRWKLYVVHFWLTQRGCHTSKLIFLLLHFRFSDTLELHILRSQYWRVGDTRWHSWLRHCATSQIVASIYGEFRDRLLVSACAIHEMMFFLLRYLAVLTRKLPLYCKNRIHFVKRELAERHSRRKRHFADLTQVTTSSGHTAQLDSISRQVTIFRFNHSYGLNFEIVPSTIS